jgi:hypothetical protein
LLKSQLILVQAFDIALLETQLRQTSLLFKSSLTLPGIILALQLFLPITLDASLLILLPSDVGYSDCPDYGSRFPVRSAVDPVVDVATVPVLLLLLLIAQALLFLPTTIILLTLIPASAVRHGAVVRHAVAAIADRVPVTAVAAVDVAAASVDLVPATVAAVADAAVANVGRVPVIAVAAVDAAAASAVAAELAVRYDVDPAEQAVPPVALRADFVALADAVHADPDFGRCLALLGRVALEHLRGRSQ